MDGPHLPKRCDACLLIYPWVCSTRGNSGRRHCEISQTEHSVGTCRFPSYERHVQTSGRVTLRPLPCLGKYRCECVTVTRTGVIHHSQNLHPHISRGLLESSSLIRFSSSGAVLNRLHAPDMVPPPEGQQTEGVLVIPGSDSGRLTDPVLVRLCVVVSYMTSVGSPYCRGALSFVLNVLEGKRPGNA